MCDLPNDEPTDYERGELHAMLVYENNCANVLTDPLSRPIETSVDFWRGFREASNYIRINEGY